MSRRYEEDNGSRYSISHSRTPSYSPPSSHRKSSKQDSSTGSQHGHRERERERERERDREPQPHQSVHDKIRASLASYRRPGLSQDELEELFEAFCLFDSDESGEINCDEFRVAIENCGMNVERKNRQNKIIFSLLERISKKELTFNDFLNIMTARLNESENRDDIMKVFRLFDEDNRGFITYDDLMRISRELGENCKESDLMEMIEKADANRDGVINFEEFYSIMVRKTATPV